MGLAIGIGTYQPSYINFWYQYTFRNKPAKEKCLEIKKRLSSGRLPIGNGVSASPW